MKTESIETVPCKPDTICFKFMKILDEAVYSEWGNKEEYVYYKKSLCFSVRYYSGAGIISVKIYSISKFLYGYSQWEELDLLLDHFVDETINTLHNEFNIDVTEDKIRTAIITELHINKDFYFSKKRNAERFIEWLKLFEFKREKKFNEYPTGFKRHNNSWTFSVYDKVVRCKSIGVPYFLINNSVACIRIELQLKKGKMNRMPKKLIKGAVTIEKVFESQQVINDFWECFAEEKLLIYPTIISKAEMKNFAGSLNFRRSVRGKQQIVDYLMLTSLKGIKRANAKYSSYSHFINEFKHAKTCPIYLGLYVLNDLVGTNSGTREITDLVVP